MATKKAKKPFVPPAASAVAGTAVDMEHGRYRIRAGLLNGIAMAIAYIAGRRIADATGADVEEAAANLRVLLDTNTKAELGQRVGGVPTAAEFREAFLLFGAKVTGHQRLMLQAQMVAKDHRRTAAELAKAAGYANYRLSNAQYGLLARKIGEELDYKPAAKASDGKPLWAFVLAEGEGDPDAGDFVWRLRDEVAAGLAAAPGIVRV